jgi:membrane associated rhomboid family serine protease/Flp pilus assembly protein TadD
MVVSGVSPLDPTPEQLLKWGANYGPYTLGGQYWRAISCAFVHIGIIHLLLNMWCLWNLGRLMERFLGPVVTIAAYLLTALGASTLSLAWNPMRESAGASGAIFGITGVLISVLYFGKLNLTPESVKSLLGYVVRFALLNLVYGFVVARIDNMAHLGGLISGLLIGLLLAQTVSQPREERATAQAYRLLASAVCLVLLFVAVVRVRSYAVELEKGERALDAKQYDAAIQHFRKYVAASPDDAYGHALLGFSYHAKKQCDQAASEYQRTLALKPDLAEIQASLASIYVCQGKFQEALGLFNAALPKIQPTGQNYLCYAIALNATRALPEAEAAARKSISLDSKEPRTHQLLAEILKAKGNQPEAEKETKLAESLQPAK